MYTVYCMLWVLYAWVLLQLCRYWYGYGGGGPSPPLQHFVQNNLEINSDMYVKFTGYAASASSVIIVANSENIKSKKVVPSKNNFFLWNCFHLEKIYFTWKEVRQTALNKFKSDCKRWHLFLILLAFTYWFKPSRAVVCVLPEKNKFSMGMCDGKGKFSRQCTFVNFNRIKELK